MYPNLGSTSTCQTSLLNAFCKKKKGKGDRGKGDAEDLNAIRVMTKFNKGDEPMR
jgi:hypothetical protein